MLLTVTQEHEIWDMKDHIVTKGQDKQAKANIRNS